MILYIKSSFFGKRNFQQVINIGKRLLSLNHKIFCDSLAGIINDFDGLGLLRMDAKPFLFASSSCPQRPLYNKTNLKCSKQINSADF